VASIAADHSAFGRNWVRSKTISGHSATKLGGGPVGGGRCGVGIVLQIRFGASKGFLVGRRTGILPGLFGNHLLDKAVFLQLEQVATRLPKLEEELIAVPMEGAQEQAYKDLEEDMLAAVRTLVQRGNRQLLGSMVNSLLYYEDTCYAPWDPLGYYEGGRDGRAASRRTRSTLPLVIRAAL
jgi:hypothetical protein